MFSETWKLISLKPIENRGCKLELLICKLTTLRFRKHRTATGQCACGFGVKARATRKMCATRWSLIFCYFRQTSFHAHFPPKPGRIVRSPRSVSAFAQDRGGIANLRGFVDRLDSTQSGYSSQFPQGRIHSGQVISNHLP